MPHRPYAALLHRKRRGSIGNKTFTVVGRGIVSDDRFSHSARPADSGDGALRRKML